MLIHLEHVFAISLLKNVELDRGTLRNAESALIKYTNHRYDEEQLKQKKPRILSIAALVSGQIYPGELNFLIGYIPAARKGSKLKGRHGAINYPKNINKGLRTPAKEAEIFEASDSKTVSLLPDIYGNVDNNLHQTRQS